jgi:hypothetical protein
MKKILISALILLISAIAVWIYLFHDLPRVDSLSSHLIQPSVRITDRNGQLLYEIIPSEGGRHTALAFSSIPQCIKDATIAVEDRNFYTNPGVDVEGILRALWINVQGGETLAGGSTITQQVARNLLLTEELGTRSPRRKAREIVLAWQMTSTLQRQHPLALPKSNLLRRHGLWRGSRVTNVFRQVGDRTHPARMRADRRTASIARRLQPIHKSRRRARAATGSVGLDGKRMA